MIGAGVAGLAAARELGRRGREVVVLEARDRIGGRIHTVRERGWPVPLEAGAEVIHGTCCRRERCAFVLRCPAGRGRRSRRWPWARW
ncbi:MAG TPA: FAD-dependent oxidoreductase [Myxococcales bacterium]|nr:FAD-dependent oxidoreductase [Myxococcales bacterium]